MPKQDHRQRGHSEDCSRTKRIKKDSEISNLGMNQTKEDLEEIKDIPTLIESLSNIFPLQMNRKEIRLKQDSCTPVEKGYLFKGKYQNLPIQCTAVLTRDDNAVEYEWSMSRLLVICRNMGNYTGRFRSTSKQANIKMPRIPTDRELWFLVEPVYPHSTLRDYLKYHKSKGTCLQPLYFVQMAISLFSMLADAHALNIGLVDITEDSLRVGIDGGLYFVGFRNCLPLDQEKPLEDKPWIDLSVIRSPDQRMLERGEYKREADVYIASRLLKTVIDSNFYRDEHQQLRKQLRYILKPGLQKGQSQRATAKELLESFERLRFNALNIKSESSF